MSAIFMSI